MNDVICLKLKSLPDLPGVYQMFNDQGQIIYVGKAVNLKNRVRQYFHAPETLQAKVRAMVSHVNDFTYIITNSETEALTLECNLIKTYRPHYNILLKDDKTFPYVRLDINRDFPRFEVVRRVKDDGARYFGPYLSGIALRDALNIIRDYFPVRHCKKDIAKAIARRERPCIMYNVGKCCAPCSGKVSREQYHALLDSVCEFLSGDIKPLLAKLTVEMQAASDAMEYEKAAQLRDRINSIRLIGEKQEAIAPSHVERDVFALAISDGEARVFAMFIRGGKIIGTECFQMSSADDPPGEIIGSFLKQFYSEAAFVPREVVVRDAPDDQEALLSWLENLRRGKVGLICPQRGAKFKQAELAYKNGMDMIRRERDQKRREWERGEGALGIFSERIGLSYLPHRMECYDNSHMGGTATVGAMVVFLDGQPAPKEYRRFRIKADANGDDYLAMREVLTRRFERALSGDVKFTDLPDLIVVDGGRGQLNVALEVLNALGLSHIPVIGLAERNEELILPDDPQPLVLPRNSPELHIVERLRDEAHRFAITYHRNVRARKMVFSALDAIEGIGEKRKRALYDHLITLEAIKAASVEALSGIPGMNRSAAEAIYRHFHDQIDTGDKNGDNIKHEDKV